jgi:hypothetical protein
MSDDQMEPWAQNFLRALGYLLVQANMLDDALVDVYRVVTNKRWSEILDDIRNKTLGGVPATMRRVLVQLRPSRVLGSRADCRSSGGPFVPVAGLRFLTAQRCCLPSS